MKTLKETLTDFWSKYDETDVTEDNLIPKFKCIAEKIINGGYINVYNQYRIYVTSVEFYFHQETPKGIKDEIVYHRNGGKDIPPEIKSLPYFPLMQLNAHPSGYDITFENEKFQTRASALIRAFSICDYNTENPIEDAIVKNDRRSTFLYYYLNGFPIDKDNQLSKGITWVDEDLSSPHLISQPHKRKNVDQRLWAFSISKQ